MEIQTTSFKKYLTAAFIIILIASAIPTAADESRADYEFSLYFVDDTKYLSPNIDPDNIVAKLENTGTLDDTYTLDISLVPVNWSITFDNAEMQKDFPVSAGTSEDVFIIINFPESGEAYIKLKAKSQNSGTEKTAFITLNVTAPIIKMDLDSNGKTVLPLETATFELNLTNLQDTPENVTVSITGSDITPSATPKADQWTYRLTDQSVIIELIAKESKLITIEIDSPTNTDSNQMRAFRLTARPDSDTDNFIEDEISVTVEGQDSVVGTPEPAEQTAKAGEVVDFTVTLLNNGTGDLNDVTLFKATLPPGWEFIYNASMKYAIDRQESTDVGFQVSVPAFAKVGKYKLQMNIYAKQKSDPIGNFSVVVTVAQNFDLVLANTGTVSDPTSGEQRYVVDMNLDTDAGFTLKNTGNGPDTISLDISNVTRLWDVYFKSIEPASGDGFNSTTTDFSKILDLSGMISANKRLVASTKGDTLVVTLDSLEEVKIIIGVNSSYSGLSEHNFTVNAAFGNNSKAVSLGFEIILIRSELEITDVVLSKVVPREEEEVFITVTVENRYHLSAKNITVVLFISDKRLDEKNIDEVAVNGTSTVEFKWTPTKKGSYTMDVELTGAVINAGTEPVYNRNVTVEQPAGEIKNGNGDSSAIYLVILVIVVLTILAGVFLYISRERVKKLSERRNNGFKKKNGNGIEVERKRGREFESSPQLKDRKPPKQLPPPKGPKTRK